MHGLVRPGSRCALRTHLSNFHHFGERLMEPMDVLEVLLLLMVASPVIWNLLLDLVLLVERRQVTGARQGQQCHQQRQQGRKEARLSGR